MTKIKPFEGKCSCNCPSCMRHQEPIFLGQDEYSLEAKGISYTCSENGNANVHPVKDICIPALIQERDELRGKFEKLSHQIDAIRAVIEEKTGLKLEPLCPSCATARMDYVEEDERDGFVCPECQTFVPNQEPI